MLNDLIITVGHTLLSKHIPFCIYRFPGESKLNLCLEKDLLPLPGAMTFHIAPFVSISDAPDIYLSVVPEKHINENLLKQLAALPEREPVQVALPLNTSQETYYEQVQQFLKEIKEGRVRKAILSRVSLVDKPEKFDPPACFEKLCLQHPQAFTHIFYHPQAGLWLGASPELLLKKEHHLYRTMALAATQPVNENHTYQWRNKELQEHEMVGEHIESVFSKMGCTLTKKTGPESVEAGSVAHLQTNYEFTESAPLTLSDLLHTLHPTPAVGGLPVQEGLACIQKYEGYDRRYYCGFLGETDFTTHARIFINLRCMQVGEKKIAVFCGGGITADSDPEEEWNETVQKSSTMLDSMVDLHAYEIVR